MSTWWDRLFGRGQNPKPPLKPASSQPLKGGLGDAPSEAKIKKARPLAPPTEPAPPAPVKVAPWQKGTDPPKQFIRVTIGLDFGTSSTKCAFREERDDAPWYFVAFPMPGAADGSLLFPTTVVHEGGKLWFGGFAESLRSARKVRGFKLCVLCSCGKGVGPCVRCTTGRPGTIDFGGMHLDAEEISVLNLAMVLGEVRRRLRAVWPGATIRLNVNAAAPIDPADDKWTVREAFERIVHRAVSLAEGAPEPASGWALSAAQAALARSAAQPMLSPEQRSTTVYPEAHAAMVGLVLLPESTGGLYAIADVGSGTTDVAVFWLQKSPEATKAWYYRQGSRPVGMETFDRMVAAAVNVSAERGRERRESMADAELAGLFAAYRSVVDEMYGQFRKTLWLARGRRPGFERDFADGDVLKYRLCLVGGGFLCHPVRTKFRKPDEQAPVLGRRWQELPEVLRIPADSILVTPKGEQRTIAQSAVNGLLLLAYGLAHPRPEIPEWHHDDQAGFDSHSYERATVKRAGDWFTHT